MLKLNEIDIYSKPEIERIFKAENSGSADYCFGNVYMWNKRFRQEWALSGNRLIMLLDRREGRYFAFPVGAGDIKSAIADMEELSSEPELPLRICGVCEEHKAQLEEAFPGGFVFVEDRDFSDYLYNIDKLADYPGKELHAKRNFCNRFEAEHAGSWSFEPLTGERIPDCTELLRVWNDDAAGDKAEGIEYERDAIMRAFEHFDGLGLEGGVLYAEGSPVGFTVGEKISSDCFCVHFEKAHAELAGAYAMVCREFARMIREKHPEISYVNREEDMGLDSLRQSKLSYKPAMILKKYLASRIW